MTFNQYITEKKFKSTKITLKDYLQIDFKNGQPEILRDVMYYIARYFYEDGEFSIVPNDVEKPKPK